MSAETTTATPAVNLAELYTPGQLDVINELRQIQAELKLSDAQFATKHLTISSTVWYRLQRGEYSADPVRMLGKIEADLRNYRIQLAQAARLIGSRPFHSLTQQKAVSDAVVVCKLKPVDDPDRLVVFLAPTGGGKTTLGRQLMVQHNGILVEGRESWRRSYLAALIDIATAAGVREMETLAAKGERGVEAKLFEKLNANRRVLIIDEGEYFGPRTINLVKEILNLTPTTVVLLAIPSLYDWWQQKSWEQAKQLNRRAEAVVVDETITGTDVKKFLDGAGIQIVHENDKLNSQAACDLIAKAASEFGAYDTVTRVVESLAKDFKKGEVTAQAVATAITHTKKLLNRRS